MIETDLFSTYLSSMGDYAPVVDQVWDEEDHLVRSVCLGSLYEFVKEFWSTVEDQDFVGNWHVELICNHLEAVTKGEIKRLVINIPPGCSKSLIVSVFWTAWIWARDPSRRIFCASYDQALSTRDSLRMKAVITSEKYRRLFPHVQLTKGEDQKTYYKNSRQGWRMATSVGGHGTGEHPDFILIDDAHNVKQAESEVERQSVIDWCDLTMSSRGIVRDVRWVVIMQRLNERDLTGHVLSKGGWIHLMLPMRFEPDRACVTQWGRDIRTEDGDLLVPQLFPEFIVRDLENNLGPYGTAGQLQQRPSPRGGGMFKRQFFNQRVKAAPYDCTRIRYVDRAATCLVAGTLVETKRGFVPIELVTTADFVLTRSGYKRVLKSWQSGEVDSLVAVKFANGSEVVGTPDHRVWTANRGWTRLDSLRGSDIITAVCSSSLSRENRWQSENVSVSDLTESLITEQKENGISRLTSGIRRVNDTVRTPSTAQSGGFTTETFPKDMTFITLTKIGITTRFLTLSALPDRNITGFIIPLRSGTVVRRRKSLGRRTGKRFGQTLSIKNTSVSAAKLSLSHGVLTNPLNTVPPSAVTDFDSGLSRSPVASVVRSLSESLVLIVAPTSVLNRTGLSLVKCAESPSEEIKQRKYAVEDRVRERTDGRIAVYDLEVEDAHEFFANGILVHNSDGGCFSACVLIGKSRESPPKYYVEHVVRGQWEPRERNLKIKSTAFRDRSKYGQHEPIHYIEAERGSTGLESFQNIAVMLEGFRVKEDMPSGSKDTRAEPWSDACAAGLVYIVDDGTWDVEAYIHEHESFKPEPGKRLGKWKDQVDASSGAYNLLAGRKTTSGFRTITFGQKKSMHKFLVCDDETLASSVIDNHHTLLVSFQDPPPIGSGEAPAHGMTKLIDSLVIQFADIDPADYQDKWEEEIYQFGKPPADVIMSRDHGKSLWQFLLKKRQIPASVIVFHGNSIDRALSPAVAVCQTLGYRLEEAIYVPGVPEQKMIPTNKYVYETTRSTRSTVV